MDKNQEKVTDILRELLCRDGVYVETGDIEEDIVDSILKKIGVSIQSIDDRNKIFIFYEDKRICNVYKFATLLWDKMVQEIISVLGAQGYIEIYNELIDSRIDRLKEMISEAESEKIL